MFQRTAVNDQLSINNDHWTIEREVTEASRLRQGLRRAREGSIYGFDNPNRRGPNGCLCVPGKVHFPLFGIKAASRVQCGIHGSLLGYP